MLYCLILCAKAEKIVNLDAHKLINIATSTLSDSLDSEIRDVVEHVAHREKSDTEYMECVKNLRANMKIHRALREHIRNAKEEN